MKVILILLLADLLRAFLAQAATEASPVVAQSFHLNSTAFSQGEELPTELSKDGGNQPPPLNWWGEPSGTREYVLRVDDPDAPHVQGKYPFVHWIVYSIPVGADNILGALQTGGAKQGINSFGEMGWGGPLPPVGGGEHHYFFSLFALDTNLDLPDGASKDQIFAAMQGHVLGIATLMGTFERLSGAAKAG
jgi:Raf kinase inhibitor-like YbhB/YbcL family protein